MRILTSEYHDTLSGWTLEPTAFDAFNLLVGVSGAGKTRIVRAIERVCAVGLARWWGSDTALIRDARGARFALSFEHGGSTYRWEAEMEPPVEPRRRVYSEDPSSEPPLVRTERITQGGREIVVRGPDRFVLNGQTMPKLGRSQSAITTLRHEPTVAPIHAAFEA